MSATATRPVVVRPRETPERIASRAQERPRSVAATGVVCRVAQSHMLTGRSTLGHSLPSASRARVLLAASIAPSDEPTGRTTAAV